MDRGLAISTATMRTITRILWMGSTTFCTKSVGTLAWATYSSPDVSIEFLFIWSVSLYRSDRTWPLVSSPWNEHSWRNLSAVKWYTSDADKAMQHNNSPQGPTIETQPPKRPMAMITTGNVWGKTRCATKDEPSGLHPIKGKR